MKAKKYWVLAISIGLFIAASPWVAVVADTKGEANDVKVQRKAKWANMDNWRKLNNGADESTVRHLLGEPKHIQCGSEGSTWYYLSVPDSPRPGARKRIGGYVGFKNKSTNPVRDYNPPYPLWKPDYTVSGWTEPNWESLDTNSTYETKTQEKSTLERSRTKWKNSSNWRKLKFNMRQNEVRSLLGEPREISGKGTWKYTPRSERGVSDKLGVLVFYNKTGDTYFLDSWEEPFWPSVEKDLQEKKE